LICPVPLDQWTADMGGRNITIHIAVQSWAQLKQKYGDPGAASIINNTATLLVYGGTRDPDDLAAYVTLVGERDEDVRTWDHEQRVATTTTRRVPVLTAAQIAQLPFGKVPCCDGLRVCGRPAGADPARLPVPDLRRVRVPDPALGPMW
jgi:type IV secretion system protein VirD4